MNDFDRETMEIFTLNSGRGKKVYSKDSEDIEYMSMLLNFFCFWLMKLI